MNNDDEIIYKVEQKIIKLRTEIEELEQFLATYRKLQGQADQRSHWGAPVLESIPVLTQGDYFPGEVPDTKVQAAYDIALALYKRTKRPVKSRDILNEMQRMGFGIKRDNDTTVLNNYLTGRFKMIRGAGWVPVEYYAGTMLGTA